MIWVFLAESSMFAFCSSCAKSEIQDQHREIDWCVVVHADSDSQLTFELNRSIEICRIAKGHFHAKPRAIVSERDLRFVK